MERHLGAARFASGADDGDGWEWATMRMKV